MTMVQDVAELRPRPYLPLGRRVRQLRLERGLTQYELADQVGISRGYPPLIEAGKNRPDAAILRRIADVLSADYAELAALAGFMPRSTEIRDVVSIDVPAGSASLLRRISRLPRQAVEFGAESADRFAEALGTWLEEETPSAEHSEQHEQPGGHESQHEGDEDEGDDQIPPRSAGDR